MTRLDRWQRHREHRRMADAMRRQQMRSLGALLAGVGPESADGAAARIVRQLRQSKRDGGR